LVFKFLLGNMAIQSIEKVNAMWQVWQASDMLNFVEEYGKKGDADSVLLAMDKAAETSWMMNMGPTKGKILEEAFKNKRRVLEIGTFLGYSTIRLSRILPPDGRLTTIEIDETNYQAARHIVQKALGSDDRIRMLCANASAAIAQNDERLGGPFDAVLMDHWKPLYATDLQALVQNKLLRPGALVIADNVLFPGAPDLLEYLRVPYIQAQDEVSGQPCLHILSDFITAQEEPVNIWSGRVWSSKHFDTSLVPVPFEYRPETPDALSLSTYRAISNVPAWL